MHSANLEKYNRENRPLEAKRMAYLHGYERVSSSNPKVWWYRKKKQVQRWEKQHFEMPFLTQHYFQTHLLILTEACVSEYVRKHAKGECKRWRVKETDTLELSQWTRYFENLELPINEYSAKRTKILWAIELLRHKAIHREPFEIDKLWLSMRLPELLEDWNRAFEVQQVFQFVLEDPQMEVETKEKVDQLLFGPKPPSMTLLEAHTWLQNSLEDVCFRFVKREYPEMLKDRGWEYPEQCELQESWTNALSAIPDHEHSLGSGESSDKEGQFFLTYDIPDRDRSLDSAEVPDEEDRLFSHRKLRTEVFHIARRLRDAASHRDCLSLTSMRKYTLNAILLAIMLGDREQAIDIEVTVQAFLTGQTKYKVLIGLREDCALDKPIPGDQLGERKKREALGAYLGDKEVCVQEVQTPSPSQSPVVIRDLPTLAEIFPVEDDGNDGHDKGKAREALSPLLELAINKFVIGGSIHEVLASAEDLWVAGRMNQAAVQGER